ncbi:WSC domain-containing protein, partial [Tricladium varicosporioides]
PTVTPTWALLGCYLDATPPTLSNRTSIVNGDSAMTIEACETACYFGSGFLYAGVETGSQCWCGSFVANERTVNTTCNIPCAGKPSEICGGTGRINVYKAILPVVTASTIQTSSSTATSKSTATPSSTSMPTWFPIGCYSDDSSARSLNTRTSITGGDTNMSSKNCIAACGAGGFTYAGVENGVECYCDSAIRSSGTPSDGCSNIACKGNATEICGGVNRLNVFLNPQF